MKRGFTYQVAPPLVRENPGRTASEYAELALRRGLCQSNSKTPVQSLANTLAKEVREGRHPDIRAQEVQGQLRYFPSMSGYSSSVSRPSNVSSTPSPAQQNEEAVVVSVPNNLTQVLDLFVEVGKCNSRAEAARRFMELGIKHDADTINNVRKAAERIREIKRSI